MLFAYCFGMARTDPMRHVLGRDRRAGEIFHMCPGEGCGMRPRPFCPVCLGAGLVDDERLTMWLREQNAAVGPTQLDDARRGI